MFSVLHNLCAFVLHRQSDTIVNASYTFAVPNQPIPAWVPSLPEPTRSEKIAMIKKYGSPNVFSQFQPHVTLAFDASTSSNLSSIFSSLPIKDGTTKPQLVGLGTTGPDGTVLSNKDLAEFKFCASSTTVVFPSWDHGPMTLELELRASENVLLCCNCFYRHLKSDVPHRPSYWKLTPPPDFDKSHIKVYLGLYWFCN